jgi:hypothetical protein
MPIRAATPKHSSEAKPIDIEATRGGWQIKSSFDHGVV